MSDNTQTALVLSGGGVRGAYEVGVVAGIVRALGLTASDSSPFSIFTGTSVGGINAAFFASRADRGDLGVTELEALWAQLRLERHLRVRVLDHVPVLRNLRRPRGRGRRDSDVHDEAHGWSILDPSPIEKLVREGIDWAGLHRNTASGRVAALIIAALDIASGRTMMFAELGPNIDFRPSPDPLRDAERTALTARHVLASAALPLLFPARWIDGAYYCDGGLRFNTPIAPAIRTGAEKLVIIPVLRNARPVPSAEAVSNYPRPLFLIGKLLNAMLADPVNRDLQILARFNAIIESLDVVLTDDELARFRHVMAEDRGLPYRRLDTLVIRPSADIGIMAGDYLREFRPGMHLPGLEGMLFRAARSLSKVREADWASYVLFDGRFAQRLIELGEADAHAQAPRIREFFGA